MVNHEFQFQALDSMNNPANTLESQPYILVVHSDPEILEQLNALLEDYGNLLFAMDIETALYRANEHRVDLALLGDVIIDTPGTELIRYLRAIPRNNDTVALILTDNHSQEHAEQLLSKGAADLITQPLSSAVLRARLYNYLKLKRQADWLRSQTLIDALTGTANVQTLHRELGREWRRAHRNGSSITVVLVEMDYFNQYIGHYGQESADQCLITVATALASTIKRPADWLARYGEHTFMLLLPETTLHNARLVAERANRAVEKLTIPHAAATPSSILTLSIGIAGMQPSTVGQFMQDKLIKAAEEALHFAKLFSHHPPHHEPS